MKHAKIFLLCASMVAMGCCNFLSGKSLTDITLNTNGISEDSLIEMSKKPYMVPYIKYLMKDIIRTKNKDIWFFTLAYIDDDEIPEMIVKGDGYFDECFPIPYYVLSQYDGFVSSIDAHHGVEYNEREGLLINTTGGSGASIIRVFQLKNGKFELTANEVVLMDELGRDVYYFNDAKVDQETAERLLGETFEYKETTISIEDLEWMSWADLLKNKESIKGWK